MEFKKIFYQFFGCTVWNISAGNSCFLFIEQGDFMETKKKGIYFGWWIVATCFLLMMTVYSGAYNLAGMFVPYMAEDLGVSTTAVTTSITILFFGVMAGSLAAGHILEKFDMRKVTSLLLVVAAISFFGAARSNTLALQYVWVIVRGLALAGVLTIPISILITNWFGKKMKGKAMSIAMIGSGIGTMALNPITAYIIEAIGWRNAYIVYAVMCLVMIIPVVLTFVRKPEDKGLVRIGDDPEEMIEVKNNDGLAYKFALKTFMFWGLMLVFILISTISQNWMISGYSYLYDVGFDAVLVGTMFTVNSLGITVGKVFFGIFNDKFGSKKSWIFSLAIYAVAYIILMTLEATPSTAIAFVGSAIMGFTTGSIVLLMPLSASELFGTKAFGRIYSNLDAGTTFGSSLLPLVNTLIFDVTGSFHWAWISNIAMSVVTIIVVVACYGVKKRTYEKAVREEK